jgi:hypothetical protein
VVAWLVFRYARLFARSIRYDRGVGLPYEPVPDPDPPDPVVMTGGTKLIAVSSLVWSAGHVILVGVWAATGVALRRDLHHGMVAAYAVSASAVMAMGAVLLLRCNRYGRRVLGMGCFLFALAAYLGVAMSLVFRVGDRTPPAVAAVAHYIAFATGGHLAVDTALGAGVRFVGRPEAPEQLAA